MMEFIVLHSIFQDNLVISSIPNYLILKLLSFVINIKKTIRSVIFIFKKMVTDINIDANTPDS